MDMGVMRQRRSPSMEDQGSPDVRTQMLGIGSNGTQCLGSGVKQQAINHRLVVIGDRADGCRQGENHMIIVYRQQIGLPGLQPASSRAGLALRAMAVAAGVIRNIRMRTLRAAQHMSTQRCAAALLDGGHDLELAEAQVRVLSVSPGWPMGTENIRDLYSGLFHGDGLRGAQTLDRADHFTQDLRGYMGIERRRLQAPVPEQDLNHPDIDLLFQ